MRSLRLSGLLCLAIAASLSACGPSGGVASPGSTPGSGGGDIHGSPVEMSPQLPQASFVSAVESVVRTPAAISPTAKTTIDDAAIAVAWDALDNAAYAVDVLLAAKPKVAGTPIAKQLAQALEGASTWLTIASQAQRASQADNYRVALKQVSAAMSNATAALVELKGK